MPPIEHKRQLFTYHSLSLFLASENNIYNKQKIQDNGH